MYLLVAFCLFQWMHAMAFQEKPLIPDTPPYSEAKYVDPHHGMEKGKMPPVIMELEELDSSNTTLPSQTIIDIFPPPDWFPGDILETTDYVTIKQALDEVMKSGDWFHDRRCALAVANEGSASYVLSWPSWCLMRGSIAASMPAEVYTQKTALDLFYKIKGFATGTSGVVSYDIGNQYYKVAVMWSVPFDNNLYDLWFNIKVLPKWVATDEALWGHMYYNSGPWRATGWSERVEYGVKMRGTMSEDLHSKLIVWVNADGFSSSKGYDLYTECGYHAGWFGKYCNQECLGSGWCWVDKRCSTHADCAGRHRCYTGC